MDTTRKEQKMETTTKCPTCGRTHALANGGRRITTCPFCGRITEAERRRRLQNGDKAAKMERLAPPSSYR